jgi:hypothetical protein
VLLKHRFRAPFPALLCRPCVVAHTIQADAQVRPALMTTLTPPRLSGQCPFPSALVAMPRHRFMLPAARRHFQLDVP